MYFFVRATQHIHEEVPKRCLLKRRDRKDPKSMKSYKGRLTKDGMDVICAKQEHLSGMLGCIRPKIDQIVVTINFLFWAL